MKVIKFDPADGRIVSVSSYPGLLVYDHPYLVQGIGLAAEDDAEVSDAAHFIRAGEVVTRSAMPVVRDGLHLAGLPVPCGVTINGAEYSVDDGALELAFPQPGTYQVTLSAWPYLDTSFEVTA